MRKFLATTLIVLACAALPMMLTQSDPGTTGDSGIAVADSIVCDSCPPMPEGYEGPWPPPDWNTTSSDTSGGDSPPYEEPNE